LVASLIAPTAQPARARQHRIRLGHDRQVRGGRSCMRRSLCMP